MSVVSVVSVLLFGPQFKAPGKAPVYGERGEWFGSTRVPKGLCWLLLGMPPRLLSYVSCVIVGWLVHRTIHLNGWAVVLVRLIDLFDCLICYILRWID